MRNYLFTRREYIENGIFSTNREEQPCSYNSGSRTSGRSGTIRSIDFTATKITENSFQVRKAGGESLLPVAALYGANAGGKSNVVDALDFMAEYVLDSFAYGDSLKDDGDRRLTARRAEPFAFEASFKEKPSSFGCTSRFRRKTDRGSYNYGFTVGKAGVEGGVAELQGAYGA